MQTPYSDNFIWLLAGLIFLLFSGAIFDQYQLEYGSHLVNVSITGALLVAIWSQERDRKWLSSRVVSTLILLGMMTADAFVKSAALSVIQLSTILGFLLLSTYFAARQVLFSGKVDRNTIVGAICLYILMGLLWAFIYLICEYINPGSLSGLEHTGWHRNMQDVIYFSFVTITSLGYGDILPVTSLARFFTYMQVVTGQFYMAILVASLIGIRLAQHSSPPEDKT
jgi:voltage-gated potassium channel